MNRKSLQEAVLAACQLSPGQREELTLEQAALKKPVWKLLLDKNLITEQKLLDIFEEHLGLKRVDLFNYQVSPEAAALIPYQLARRYNVIPLGEKAGKLYLAAPDPFDLEAFDNISKTTGKEVQPVLAGYAAVAHAINGCYFLHEPLRPAEAISLSKTNDPKLSQESMDRDAEGPVVKMINSLIKRAIEEGASDIHLEPARDGLRVRMRLDGILQDLSALPGRNQARLVSRVKVMAGLDIAEKRLPQDGNIVFASEQKQSNLRVSTMPTIYGEKAVIRLLGPERIVLPLEELGFSTFNHRLFKRLLLNQSGMILVTGPTGCGKTTTLYSALNYLNRPEDNIITVEDPVECRLDGINQVQVNRRIGRTFAGALKFILRQDPNIIMIGEIRDPETAKIAVQAALTGHLVLSTLHTVSAAGSITRLVEMGLEKYMVSASVAGVIAQRLVRLICPGCRREYLPDEGEKKFYRYYFGREAPPALYSGSGCRSCSKTGYRGRTTIGELLPVNRKIQDLVLKGASALDLQAEAVNDGMITLAADGRRLIESGLTTVSEVVRATYSSAMDGSDNFCSENDAFVAHIHERAITAGSADT